MYDKAKSNIEKEVYSKQNVKAISENYKRIKQTVKTHDYTGRT